MLKMVCGKIKQKVNKRKIMMNILTRFGVAFFPSKKSLAEIAGTSEAVSGYKSSWNNSD